MTHLAHRQQDISQESKVVSNREDFNHTQIQQQLDIFSGEVSNVVQIKKSKVIQLTKPPRLEQVPLQESIPLSDKEFFSSLHNSYDCLFKDVNFEEVQYDSNNSIIKFVSQGLEFKIEFQWNNIQYHVENTKFNVSDLWKFSANFSLLFAKICNYFWFNKSQIYNVKKSKIITDKKAKELSEPHKIIYLETTDVNIKNLQYLKYNGNIEINKACLHFKIWNKVYRVSNICYTINQKNPRDTESEISVSIDNPNNLSIKILDKYKRRISINDKEMINWFKYLSYHILLNYNPHITSDDD